MFKGMRILALLGLVLASSSYSSVEATASRRVSGQKVRGLKKDDPSAKKRFVANLPGQDINRPLPGALDKFTIDLKPPKETPAPKLPETQAVHLKVNKKTGKPKHVNKKVDASTTETGLEHFQEVEVEVYRRDIPSFSVRFNIEDSSTLPNLADFNELSQVSEEYLDKFFGSVFEDLKVMHDDTSLYLMASEGDSFVVEFKLSLAFVIPGEVPTINFLIDHLRDAFEKETSAAFYLADLTEMSETNPFSKTVSYEVLSYPPVSAAEMDRTTGGPSQIGGIEILGSNYMLVSLLAGAGFVVLIGTGMMWKKQKSKRAISDSNEAFSLFDKSNKKGSSGVYGADDDTMNYLNSIRKRYKDNGGNSSSDSVSSDENLAIAGSGSYDDPICTVQTEEC